MENTAENSAPRSEADDDGEYWRISKKKVGGLTRLLVYVVLPLLVLVIIFNLDNRVYFFTHNAKVSAFFPALGVAKEAITAQLTENPQAEIGADIADLIPSELPIEGASIDYKTVSRDGTIIAVSHPLGAVVVLHPQIEAGEIEWSCRVSSIHGNKAIPARCREPIGE